MPLLIDNNKIKSLLNLLEDEDKETYDLVSSQILDMGYDLLPYLLEAEDNSVNTLLSSRLKFIRQQLNLDKSLEDLREWKMHNSKNLYQGLSIISKYEYPRLELKSISELINKLRQDLWLEINDNLTALEKVRILNHLFFEVYGFIGNSKDYYAPENSFLNDVLMLRKGNPVSLSIVYSIVAQSVNIPIYGVNLPRNFMLVYVEKLYSQSINKIDNSDILFYINPYNKGEIHSQKDVLNYLRKIKKQVDEKYYLPCSNITIISRTIRNIINAFDKKGDKNAISNYEKLLEVLV